MWTKKDIHVERVYPDEEFWAANVIKAKLLFQRSVLPELVGKFYSRQPQQARPILIDQPDGEIPSTSGRCNTSVSQGEQDTHNVYCYCQGPEEGEMVGCDNSECSYKWFHLSCLKMKVPPKSKYWFCPDCRKISSQKKKRKITSASS